MKNFFLKCRNLLVILLIQQTITYSQNLYLDPSFDYDGIVTTNILEEDVISAMAIQPDGKILVTGYVAVYPPGRTKIVLARYNMDGSLDNSFDLDGIQITDIDTACEAKAIAIQPDGKILVAGNVIDTTFNFLVARYNIDGSLDNSFDSDGIVKTTIGVSSRAYSLAIQPDGKILMAGTSEIILGSPMFALARYNSDGSLDNSFDSDGIVTTGIHSWGEEIAYSIAIQSNGKIVLGGTSIDPSTYEFDYALARYNIDGSLDNSFDGDGIVTTPFFGLFGAIMDTHYTLTLQPDGNDDKIITAGGAIGGNFVLIRYNSDGSLDNSFDGNGIVTTYMPGSAPDAVAINALLIQADGKILASGISGPTLATRFSLLRYNTDGSLDNSFDSDGMITSTLGSIGNACSNVLAVQFDSKIVLAGFMNGGLPGPYNADLAIARYTTIAPNAGTDNYSTESISATVYPNPITNETILSYTLQEKEKISIILIDEQGKLISTIIQNNIQEAGNHQQKIKLSEGLSSGVYYLIVSNNIERISIKLVK